MPTHDHPAGNRLPLISEMRQQIQATAMLPQPHSRFARRPDRRSWAAVTVLAAILVIAVLVLARGAVQNPPPAFAATLNSDRTVTITLREMRDIPKLNARLASLRTRIRVVPVLPGCVAPVHSVSNGRPLPGPARTLRAARTTGPVVSMTIEVNTLPERTLVIADSRSGMYIGGAVVLGPAPACVAPETQSGQPALIPAQP